MLRKFFFLTLITSIPLYGQQEKKKVDKKETEIKEVIVTATKTKKNLKNVPITVQVITSEDIKKSQSTDFKTFLENEFSGINFTYNGGSPNINMMGFGGKYVLFLMNGERMAGETFDNIDYERIDIDNIERIEIIKGASSSLYGSNAIGGVINIITKDSKSPLDINAGYLYDSSRDHKANLSIGTKQKWGSLSLASFYKMRTPYIIKDRVPTLEKQTDPFGNEIITEKYNELNVAGFINYGFNPKLTFNLSPKIDIALTPGFYFSERNGGDPSSQKVRDHYYNYNIGLKTNFKFNENQNLSISGAFDRYDKFKYYKLLKEDEKVYENQIWRISSQYNHNIFNKHSVVAGGEIFYDKLLNSKFKNEKTGNRENAKIYSVFTQQEWAINPALTLVTGARMDYHSFFKQYFTFRLGGMYKFEDIMTIRAGYSGGFRSPTIKELYFNWFHPWGGGFQIMGNKNLKPETSDNFNLSVDFNLKKLNLTFITQYSSIKDKINTDAIVKDTIRYVNLKGYTNVLSSEVSAMYRLNKNFHFKGSYSYYDIGKKNSENRPHTLTFKAEFIPTAKYYFPSVIISGKYLSGKNWYNDSDPEKYTFLAPYSIWRLQLASKLPLGFTLTGGINNIFDYTADKVGLYSSVDIGRTFYLGLKWNFNKKVQDTDYN
ncbi:MAG: TonB-dependent receptor [Flavobacteriaceae bacterium]|nr:TonB-dependent receptor [Flavobacteriaceae bacterium]